MKCLHDGISNPYNLRSKTLGISHDHDRNTACPIIILTFFQPTYVPDTISIDYFCNCIPNFRLFESILPGCYTPELVLVHQLSLEFY